MGKMKRREDIEIERMLDRHFAQQLRKTNEQNELDIMWARLLAEEKRRIESEVKWNIQS